MLRFAAAVLLAALPLAGAYLLWRRVSRQRRVSRRLTAAAAAGGVVVGALSAYAETLVLGLTGMSLRASEVGAGAALLAMFLFAAPLEEALKVLVVWPLYLTHRMATARLGLVYAGAAGAGFASAEAVAQIVVEPPSWLMILRILLAMPAHVFFAGLWGYWLGSGSRGRFFGVAWFFAMLAHGLYAHIVIGRGPGLLVLAAPLFAAMLLFAWIALRDVAPRPSLPPSMRPSLLSSLPEPPSLRAMRHALRRTDRPLTLHWIGIGALVTLGVMITLLVGAVLVGHRIGIDFAMADEADVRSSGPLVLLGAAVLAAFPFAGYLVARASAATSVLEPAMGAGLAIAVLVLMLSVAAPVAVVFALAVAPVAFALACGGAWFGLGR